MTLRFLLSTWVSLAIVAAAVGCGGSSSTSSGTSSTTGGTAGAGGSSSTTGSTTAGSGGNATTTTSTTASTTSSGQGGFGGSAQGGDCGMCVVEKKVFAPGTVCAQAYSNCTKDATCEDFHVCVDHCLLEDPQTPACWAACEQAASAVANLYQPFVDCFCNSCKAECELACP